jgi:hypothetical protein
LTRNFIFLFIAVPFSSFHRSEFFYRPGIRAWAFYIERNWLNCKPFPPNYGRN